MPKNDDALNRSNSRVNVGDDVNQRTDFDIDMGIEK